MVGVGVGWEGMDARGALLHEALTIMEKHIGRWRHVVNASRPLISCCPAPAHSGSGWRWRPNARYDARQTTAARPTRSALLPLSSGI